MPLFGLTNGLQFFGTIPPWVTNPAKQPPGTVNLAPSTETPLLDCFFGVINGSFIWDTENLLWLVMSLAISICFPYYFPVNEADGSQGFLHFFMIRFALWSSIMFLYVGFFYMALYEWNFSSRPFAKNRSKSVIHRKLLHNIGYSLGGIAVWCVVEYLTCFLWATQRMETVSRKSFASSSTTTTIMSLQEAAMQTSSATTPAGHYDDHFYTLVKIVVGFPLALIIKDFHFYFIHRLIHFGPFYNYIHSVHHRNADPEPFAGIAMHPVEHILYQSAALIPILLFPNLIHNSAFTWIGLHLLISPALAHSGYEDHWQMGEAYHYYHHRFFDVNFAGGGVTFLDQWFGSGYFGPEIDDDENNKKHHNTKTLKMKNKEKRPSSSSSREPNDDANSLSALTSHHMSVEKFAEILSKAPLDEKATFNPFSPLSKDGMISPFMLLSVLCWIPWVLEFNQSNTLKKLLVEKCILASAGPLIVAIILDLVSSGSDVSGVGKMFLFLSRPFGAKRPAWETIFHFVVGISVSVIPVFVILYRCVL